MARTIAEIQANAIRQVQAFQQALPREVMVEALELPKRSAA